ncbi:MAG: DUF669 domain-containing protein [Phycisphaerales bacterium]|nr:DUF669 domain-containing protein [Phycisphaerales bacterium]
MRPQPTICRGPLPVGRYAAVIAATTWHDIASGRGRYLEIEYKVTEPGHEGRRVWERLILEHSSWRTVTIARTRLNALGRAIGVRCPNDSADLHDRPLLLDIGVRKRDDTGELVNEVTGYAPFDATPRHTSTAPWRRQEAMA